MADIFRNMPNGKRSNPFIVEDLTEYSEALCSSMEESIICECTSEKLKSSDSKNPFENKPVKFLYCTQSIYKVKEFIQNVQLLYFLEKAMY